MVIGSTEGSMFSTPSTIRNCKKCDPSKYSQKYRKYKQNECFTPGPNLRSLVCAVRKVRMGAKSVSVRIQAVSPGGGKVGGVMRQMSDLLKDRVTNFRTGSPDASQGTD